MLSKYTNKFFNPIGHILRQNYINKTRRTQTVSSERSTRSSQIKRLVSFSTTHPIHNALIEQFFLKSFFSSFFSLFRLQSRGQVMYRA